MPETHTHARHQMRSWPSVRGSAEERASKGFSRLEDITRLISEWVWEADRSGRLIYASERVTEDLGWLPIQLHGKTFFEMGCFIDQDGEEFTPDLEKPFRELMFQVKSRDGSERLLQLSGLPTYDKDTWEIEGYCGTAKDVTDQLLAIDQIQMAKNEAEKANQAKSDFLSSMSHELRTPLNAILGFGQLLGFNPNEPLTESQKDAVNHIMKGGQHLLDLINEVLDLAKIEAGKVQLNIENVSLKEVLDECLPLVETLAEPRRIQIVMSDGCANDSHLHVDRVRFKQSLLNLMSNAVKYNREGGTVTLACHKTPAEMLNIAVMDTGFGVPENQFGDLFKPFSRLDAENSEIEGTGIGLTITKQLVERMDGHIGVDSTVGEGTTFWIELPLSEEKLASVDLGETNGTVGLPNINGTVLYVEDNPANLLLMEMTVERIEGLSMISAHNAELGIELARKEKPGLIILDINLPGLNGYEALADLHAHKETQHIPVIALSANAMPRDIEKGIAAGFRHYLTKPMKVDEVMMVIKSILEE